MESKTSTIDEKVIDKTDEQEMDAELKPKPIIESQSEQDKDDEVTDEEEDDEEKSPEHDEQLKPHSSSYKPKYPGITSENIANIRILAGRYPSKSRRLYNHHPRNKMLLMAQLAGNNSIDSSSVEEGCGSSSMAKINKIFEAGPSCSSSAPKVLSPRRICNSILNSIPCTLTKVKFQFLILGDARVGKTSILRRMRDHHYKIDTNKYYHTVGPDLYRLQCGQVEAFDVGGKGEFMRVARTYCEMVTNFLIVFDIANAESFLMARYWLDFLEQKRVQRHKEWTEEGYDNMDTIFVVTLVGNKKDLEAERKVSYNWAKSMAKTYDADYFEMSAKDDVFLEPFLEQYEKKCLTS